MRILHVTVILLYSGTYCEVTDNYKLTSNQVQDHVRLTRNQEIYDNEIDLDSENDITESGLIERGVISGNSDLITVVSKSYSDFYVCVWFSLKF
jgi:hypothetical protein